jgi:anaerobic ribonucleoside-triphosphate reductase activating protein
LNVLLNKAHFPVSVLGHGRRVGIWLQGCSIGCKSCCSLDTWDFDEDRSIDVGSLVDWCRETSCDELDGVTISGGEPFDQAEGLLALLRELDAWRSGLGRNVDILLYSGRSARVVRRDFKEHLLHVDAVVAGPFKKGATQSKAWCGSDNQEIVLCSDLGESRYGGDLLKDWKTGIQVTADRDDIWMIGIPRPDDLDRLDARCRQNGLDMGRMSWRC